MNKEVVVSAKTVDEAVALAAEQLGLPVSAIEYTVIEEAKKGLFGIGAAPAKISAVARGGEYDALEFIKKLIADMQVEATVEMTTGETDDNKIITVTGEGAAILIGHHGETLDSLQ